MQYEYTYFYCGGDWWRPIWVEHVGWFEPLRVESIRFAVSFNSLNQNHIDSVDRWVCMLCRQSRCVCIAAYMTWLTEKDRKTVWMRNRCRNRMHIISKINATIKQRVSSNRCVHYKTNSDWTRSCLAHTIPTPKCNSENSSGAYPTQKHRKQTHALCKRNVRSRPKPTANTLLRSIRCT